MSGEYLPPGQTLEYLCIKKTPSNQIPKSNLKEVFILSTLFWASWQGRVLKIFSIVLNYIVSPVSLIFWEAYSFWLNNRSLLSLKYILKYSLLWWMCIVYIFVLNVFLYNSSLHARYFSHLHHGATHVALYRIFSITNECSGDWNKHYFRTSSTCKTGDCHLMETM